MLQKVWNKIKDYFKNDVTIGDYIYIFFMILLFIICNIPLNYYIIMGGGISDASNRIAVEDSYSHKGSFNISFVTQLEANVLTYVVSYILPSWEREDADLYKYTSDEDLQDIQFRADLDLKTANGDATYWAYTAAGKEVTLVSKKLYVISNFAVPGTSSLKIGDEILSMDGQVYSSVSEYRNYIATKEVGDTVTVRVKRDGIELDGSVPVFEENNSKWIGVRLQYVRNYETDPKVSILFKRNESGPSGGLITTLEIYNQLTEEDITKGKTIAGTGTIEPDGSIGEIGGIEHKILGAVTAHADVFLCPGGDNYKDAKKYIKKKNLKIKLIQVDTFMDALEKLEELS